jgi:hypothetical protein
LLLDLRLDESICAIDELDALQTAKESRRREFLDRGFDALLAIEESCAVKDKAAIGRLYAVRTALLKDKPVPQTDLSLLESRAPGNEAWIRTLAAWNAACDSCREGETRASQIFNGEMAERRSRLWRLAQDEHIAEAIFLSSPSAAKSIIKHSTLTEPSVHSDSKTRGLERRLYTYLQRLCAKNDTTSFFWPVDYGEFSTATDRALTAKGGWNARPTRRRVFWAHWVVSALAHRIAGADEVFRCLKPRRNPLLRITDSARGEFFLHGARRGLRLDGPARDILLAVDGRRSVTELTRLNSIEEASGIAILRRLAQARLIEIDLPLPSTAVDAFQALQRAIEELPPRARISARPWLEHAEELRSGFETTPWPGRQAWLERAEGWVAAELDDDARRKHGRLYADRLVLYEDCAGSLQSLKVGGPVLTRINNTLPDLLEFLTGAAVLRWYDAQAAIRAQLAASGGTMPLIELLMMPDGVQPPRPRFEAFSRRLRELIGARKRSDRVGLSALDLRSAIEPWRAEIDHALAQFPMTLPSPDLMIAASSPGHLQADDFDLILAELHDDCSTLFNGFFSCFHPGPAQLRALLEDEITSQNGWQALGTVLGSRRNKHVTPELPGTTILLSGISGRNPDATVPVAEVEIAEKDGRLILEARGRPIILYPGDVSSLVHEAFALPRVVPLDWLAIAGGERTVRIMANGIVVQRAAWDISAETLRLKAKGGLSLMDFRELRARLKALGVPEYFFVRWAQGEKPVLIDARNPLALDLVRRIADQAARFRITEMYPGPDDIFWSSTRGRHTFELRTGLLRRNSSAAGF